jgi:hypothetical protein
MAFRLIAEQRGLLGAAYDELFRSLCRATKSIKLGAAELAELGNFAIAASSLNGGRIEAHRVFARADQDRFRRIRHAQLLTSRRGLGTMASGLAPIPLLG